MMGVHENNDKNIHNNFKSGYKIIRGNDLTAITHVIKIHAE